jgi:large subunit ribosomal protein L31
MKKKIHPETFDSKVSCACGHEFTTVSTKKTIKVELCSNCHPFYTGEQKLVDSAGRVEKFNRKYGKKTSK